MTVSTHEKMQNLVTSSCKGEGRTWFTFAILGPLYLRNDWG